MGHGVSLRLHARVTRYLPGSRWPRTWGEGDGAAWRAASARVRAQSYGKPAETPEDIPEDVDPFQVAAMSPAERSQLVRRVLKAYPHLSPLASTINLVPEQLESEFESAWLAVKAAEKTPRAVGQARGTHRRGAASACLSGGRSLQRGEAFAGAAGERDDLLAFVAGECLLEGRRCGLLMPGRGKDISEIVERVALHVQRVRRF